MSYLRARRTAATVHPRASTLIAVATLALVSAPAAAHAQWTNPYTGNTWNNPTSSFLDTVIRNKMNAQMMQKSLEKGARASSSKPGAKATRITYRPAPGSRVPEELSASLLESRADREELARYLRELLSAYQAKAKEEGRANDLGFAMTFFVAGNYTILHERDVPDAATTAMNQQFDQVLPTYDGLVSASDAQKQKLAEYLVCSTGVALAGYQQGKEKGRADQVKLFRGLAAQNLKALLSIEASRIRLTDAGLQFD